MLTSLPNPLNGQPTKVGYKWGKRKIFKIILIGKKIGKKSSEIVDTSTNTGSKTIWKNEEEKNIQEYDLTRRQEKGLTGRRNHSNLTTLEADITKRRPYKKTGRR